jgi:hypothetical protein
MTPEVSSDAFAAFKRVVAAIIAITNANTVILVLFIFILLDFSLLI